MLQSKDRESMKAVSHLRSQLAKSLVQQCRDHELRRESWSHFNPFFAHRAHGVDIRQPELVVGAESCRDVNRFGLCLLRFQYLCEDPAVLCQGQKKTTGGTRGMRMRAHTANLIGSTTRQPFVTRTTKAAAHKKSAARTPRDCLCNGKCAKTQTAHSHSTGGQTSSQSVEERKNGEGKLAAASSSLALKPLSPKGWWISPS